MRTAFTHAAVHAPRCRPLDLTPLTCGAECLGHGVEGLRAIDDAGARGCRDWSRTDRRHVSRPFYRCLGRQRYSVHPRARHQSAAPPGPARRAASPAASSAPESRDKASTDRTLARAPRGDVGAERSTPRILAGRHTDTVDHAPVQRVRIRECPGRWQRNLLAGAPRTGPTNRHLPPAQHDLTRRMPRSIRLARRLMLRQTAARSSSSMASSTFRPRDDQLLELGLRINEDVDNSRGVGDTDWRRRGTVRDCFFMAAPCWEACTSRHRSYSTTSEEPPLQISTATGTSP